MKDIISNINKVFENRVRLGIMSVLMVNEKMDFKTLKKMLNASDGNIASHTNALEKEGYLEISKQFIGEKPNTTYSVTHEGRKAFQDHINALEQLIKGTG